MGPIELQNRTSQTPLTRKTIPLKCIAKCVKFAQKRSFSAPISLAIPPFANVPTPLSGTLQSSLLAYSWFGSSRYEKEQLYVTRAVGRCFGFASIRRKGSAGASSIRSAREDPCADRRRPRRRHRPHLQGRSHRLRSLVQRKRS